MSVASRSASARMFAAKARRRRLRRWLAVLAVAAMTGAVGAGVWLVGWSDVLAVREVAVEGVSEARHAEVVRVAEPPMGVPLARVDTAAVAERARALPEAADVEVRRSWPNTLTIDVTPRTPAAAVPSGNMWWKVDESGVLFGESGKRPQRLPELVAPIGDDDQPVRAAGVAVLTGLPPAVRELVESVEARSEADIRLTLADGPVVRWGTADAGEKKAEVLLALIAAQPAPPASYDVSAPERPAVTP